MCVNCSDHAQRGFTLPELVAVLVVLGILAATAMPKLRSALSFRDTGWHDQLVGALRYAQKAAVSHRRLVCADVAGGAVTLTIASANPASSCSVVLPGVDGSSASAKSGGGASASISPAGALYFQPSGRVTTDGAGSNAAARTITIVGQSNIVVVGETGRVD
jgi:MSHA pilin protein MshC